MCHNSGAHFLLHSIFVFLLTREKMQWIEVTKIERSLDRRLEPVEIRSRSEETLHKTPFKSTLKFWVDNFLTPSTTKTLRSRQ
jgi:hypothetical protein